MIRSISNHINFTSAPQPAVDEQRKQKQEQVATGIGGAAGVTATATRYAGKKGLQAQAGEKLLGELTGQVSQGIKGVNEAQEVATGLIGAFKKNLKMYTASIMEHLAKFKDTKFIGAIIKSPVTRKLSALAGGVLAFFVLFTGVNKAFENGQVAVEDLKNQFKEYKNM